jgi:hypothetical protein
VVTPLLRLNKLLFPRHLRREIERESMQAICCLFRMLRLKWR